MPQITYGPGEGFNNSKDDSQLELGELAMCVGWTYRRNSDIAFTKSGRTAFCSSAVDNPTKGLFYAEFSNTAATSKILVRAGTKLYSADRGLTASAWTTETSSLTNPAVGLWGSYAYQSYFLSDGANPMWKYWYDADAGTVRNRRASLLPPTEQPTLYAITAGTAAELTSSSIKLKGDKSYQNPSNAVDGDRDTYATVTIGTGGNNAKLLAFNFTAAQTQPWIIAVTTEAMSVNDGRGTTTIEYATDCDATTGEGTWTALETYNGVRGKQTTTKTLDSAVSSATVGVRVTATKNGDTGKYTSNIYDVRLYTLDGASTTNNTIVTSLTYWVTEAIPGDGIESVAGPRATIGGPLTTVGGIRITMPSAPVNSATTHYNIWRTVDGGAFPIGSFVARVPISATSYVDVGPLNDTPSTTTYGFIEVGNIPYDRDTAAPLFYNITTYQNAIVGVPVVAPNTLRYSFADFPESFPDIYKIAMGSDKDDTVMGFAVLSTALGVFCKGRCRRIDHLPTPADPMFGVAPEDFASDHGLESRNGIAYFTPSDGGAMSVAYVARDGLRMTNLYQTSIITDMLDWDYTVDKSRLGESYLINNASASRLEFYFIPTTTFRNDMLATTGGAQSCYMQMFLQYSIRDGSIDFRVSLNPCNFVAAMSVPISGLDYSFIASASLPNTTPDIVYVDEVGTTDAMNSWDSSGTIPRRLMTGKIYAPHKLERFRILTFGVDREARPTSNVGTLILFNGRDDVGSSWSGSYDFATTVEGAAWVKPNQSGQWAQALYEEDDGINAPGVVNFIMYIEHQGELH